MKSSTLLLALALVAAPLSAQAASFSVSNGGASFSVAPVATDSGLLASPVVNVLTHYGDVSGFAGGTLGLFNATFVQGNQHANIFNPFSYNASLPTGISPSDWYLAIHPTALVPAAAAAFLPGTPASNISFVWGSVGANDWVAVQEKGSKTYSYISGSELLKLAGLNLSQTAGTVTFSIASAVGISSILFAAFDKTFEIGGAKITAVPLPAALPLFGAALLGLAAVRRRSQKA